MSGFFFPSLYFYKFSTMSLYCFNNKNYNTFITDMLREKESEQLICILISGTWAFQNHRRGWQISIKILMQYLAKNENEDYKVARGVVPRTSVFTVLCKSSKATGYFPNSLRGRNHISTKERVQRSLALSWNSEVLRREML